MAQKEVPQIDLSYLMGFSNGSSEFIAGMLEQCLEVLSEAMTNLKRTLEEQNWQGLRMASHKFVPLLPLIGFGAILKDMKTIEIFSEELSRIPDEEKAAEIQGLVLNTLEYCNLALPELLQEYERIKNNQ